MALSKGDIDSIANAVADAVVKCIFGNERG